MPSLGEEEQSRVRYCKERNIHHLFELLATKILLDKPDDHFQYLRDLLTSVENSEKHRKVHDPTKLQSTADDAAGVGSSEGGSNSQGARTRVTLAMLGIDNAGKTTLLSSMGGNIDTNTTPTVGFTPVHFQTPNTDLYVFDLGGARNFRGIWVHYLHDCHGLIFIVDSADTDRIKESLEALRTVVSHPFMRGKPVLLFANKKDLPESRGGDIIPDGFLESVLEEGTAHRVVATCAIVKDDGSIDSGVEWMLNNVLLQFNELSQRVERDTAAMKEEKRRKLAERMAALHAQE